jgi:hypothetical protein
LFQDYENASDHCYSTFRAPIAKDASGPYRHYKIEETWCSIAERFPDLAKSEVKPYKSKRTGRRTGSYVELTIGRIKLTHACVAKRTSLPREADFRNTLAEEQQKSFWPKDSQGAANPNPYLYAVLLNGVDRKSKERSRPAFACVRFPNKFLTGYEGQSIDLFQEFPDITAKFIEVKQDFVQDVSVKRRKQERQEEA